MIPDYMSTTARIRLLSNVKWFIWICLILMIFVGQADARLRSSVALKRDARSIPGYPPVTRGKTTPTTIPWTTPPFTTTASYFDKFGKLFESIINRHNPSPATPEPTKPPKPPTSTSIMTTSSTPIASTIRANWNLEIEDEGVIGDPLGTSLFTELSSRPPTPKLKSTTISAVESSDDDDDDDIGVDDDDTNEDSKKTTSMRPETTKLKPSTYLPATEAQVITATQKSPSSAKVAAQSTVTATINPISEQLIRLATREAGATTTTGTPVADNVSIVSSWTANATQYQEEKEASSSPLTDIDHYTRVTGTNALMDEDWVSAIWIFFCLMVVLVIILVALTCVQYGFCLRAKRGTTRLLGALSPSMSFTWMGGASGSSTSGTTASSTTTTNTIVTCSTTMAAANSLHGFCDGNRRRKRSSSNGSNDNNSTATDTIDSPLDSSLLPPTLIPRSALRLALPPPPSPFAGLSLC